MRRSWKHALRITAVAAILAAALSGISMSLENDLKKRNPLTPDEERVILHRGTETPFSGRFNNHKKTGTYTCKQCDAPLYKSSSKFDSGCGWPSFDDEIDGAIKRLPDGDGSRTEIRCASCDGHLGHVFIGEQLTSNNTRHCVNSISLNFIAEDETVVATETAYFGGGCFWGMEHYLEKAEGVITARSGYMGGSSSNPSYKEVCDGGSGHVEVVEVVYDSSVTNYEKLARLFFEIHDPTQRDRQGPDIGQQYRSVVFVSDDSQSAIVANLIGILKSKGLQVVTAIESASDFWPAEAYHQEYYARNGGQPYCHSRTDRF